jgi:uroporphyrinogen-III decarboxylase
LYRHADKLIAAMDAIFPDFVNEAVNGIREPGAPVLFPASRSSNGFISPQQFEKFAFPYFKKIVEAIVSKGSPVFFHLDQSWTRFLPYFRQFPEEGHYLFHFDGMTDLFEAKKILGDRMCLMGDVPARLLKLGTPEAVKEYCKKLIKTIGRGGGFVLAAG